MALVSRFFGLLLILICHSAHTQNLGTRNAKQWVYEEWEVNCNSCNGNPFDVIATVTFTKAGSSERIVTEMFYDGGSSWKFRFNGTGLGRWNFTTTSSVNELNGINGSVQVNVNPDQNNGFMVRMQGDKWGWSGSGEAFVPNYAMYKAKPADFHQNSAQIDADIQEFLVEHGFTGFHVPDLAARWFRYDADSNRFSNNSDLNSESIVPDIKTFEALELLISKTHAAGGAVHIWLWGDRARAQNFTANVMNRVQVNGEADQRLQRYIAARLGALPGWSMGYGFDLFEWVDENMLSTWHSFMQARMGWTHFLGARGRKNVENLDDSQISEVLDYTAYEQHADLNNFQDWVETMQDRPGKPSFSEDRFRIRPRENRSKDLSFESTRTLMWQLTMAGGIAAIWGFLPDSDPQKGSAVYENKEELRTFSTFWNIEKRFLPELQRANQLVTDNTSVLKTPDNQKFIAYKEQTNTVTINLSALQGNQRVIAVNTRERYRELDLGTVSAGNRTFNLPETSDWAIAIGFEPNSDENPEPVSVTGVSLAPESLTLNIGESAQLAVAVSPTNADNQNVNFSSSDSSVVFVDETGSVMAISEGVAEITVTTVEGGFTARTTITVIRPPDNTNPVLVTGVSLMPETVSLRVGESQTLVAQVLPANADNRNVTFTSSDDALAIVNDSGQVTGVSTGSTSITVTTEDGGFTATTLVTITEADAPTDPDGIIVYPNPSRTQLKVFGHGSDVQFYTIHDSIGKLMQTGTIEDTDLELLIDISGFREGLYFLRMGDIAKTFVVVPQ